MAPSPFDVRCPFFDVRCSSPSFFIGLAPPWVNVQKNESPFRVAPRPEGPVAPGVPPAGSGSVSLPVPIPCVLPIKPHHVARTPIHLLGQCYFLAPGFHREPQSSYQAS